MRIRYNVRMLLTLAFVLSVTLAAIRWRERERERVQLVIAELSEAGVGYFPPEVVGGSGQVDLLVNWGPGLDTTKLDLLETLPAVRGTIFFIEPPDAEGGVPLHVVKAVVPQRLTCLSLTGPLAKDAMEYVTHSNLTFEQFELSDNRVDKFIPWLSEVSELESITCENDASPAIVIDKGFAKLRHLSLDLSAAAGEDSSITVCGNGSLADAGITMSGDSSRLEVIDNMRLAKLSVNGWSSSPTVVLRNCPSVQELTLQEVVCTSELWNAVGQLEQLRSLTVHEVYESPSAPVSFPSKLANLKQLTIVRCEFSKENVAKIRSLVVDGQVSIRDLYTLDDEEP